MTGPIVLVGLMGSGKTTVGRRLAALLERRFVDADEELEARAGRSIAAIFEDDGEAGFRALEAAVLADLLEEPEPLVIATGGGAVTQATNRHLLAAHPTATVVWLHGNPAFIASRIQAKPHRPLLHGEDPRAVLERLHEERLPHYRAVADLEVDIDGFRTAPTPTRAVAEHIVTELSRRAEAAR